MSQWCPPRETDANDVSELRFLRYSSQPPRDLFPVLQRLLVPTSAENELQNISNFASKAPFTDKFHFLGFLVNFTQSLSSKLGVNIPSSYPQLTYTIPEGRDDFNQVVRKLYEMLHSCCICGNSHAQIAIKLRLNIEKAQEASNTATFTGLFVVHPHVDRDGNGFPLNDCEWQTVAISYSPP